MLNIKNKKYLFITIISLFLLTTGIVIMLGSYLTAPVHNQGDDRVFIIQKGMNLREISGMLEEQGLIRSRMAFILMARFKGNGHMIRAGEYMLNPSMSPDKIMEMLIKGEVIAYNVTIPEGFKLEQIAEELSSLGLVDKGQFLHYVKQNGIEKMYGIHGPGLEGYLYPDTYRFTRGLDEKAIVDTMIRRFREMTAPLNDRLKKSWMSLHEVVTLASIVEKETGNPDERPLIAGVFLNRLKKNMRLDSDPTVIYGIKDFSGNITKRDLSTSNPYNTYVIYGLPPGPIASPGIDSIRSVLYPAETDFLYFVSKNNGSHQFSKSLAEHNRAVRIYQKKRG